MFLSTQFRMGMKVTPERDKLAFMLIQPGGDRVSRARCHAGRPDCAHCPHAYRAPARKT